MVLSGKVIMMHADLSDSVCLSAEPLLNQTDHNMM